MESIGLILLIAGFVFIGIEMAVPGFGAPGLVGIGSFIGAVLLLTDTVEEGLTLLIIILVLCAVLLTAITMLMKSRKVKVPIVLDQDLSPDKGLLSSEDLDYLVDKEGVTQTDLKPSGKCQVEGVLFDVRSNGSFISKGTAVRISKIHENSIIVEKINKQ